MLIGKQLGGTVQKTVLSYESGFLPIPDPFCRSFRADQDIRLAMRHETFQKYEQAVNNP
jgi:hypothetical protein